MVEDILYDITYYDTYKKEYYTLFRKAISTPKIFSIMNATNFVKTITGITPTRKDYEEKAPDLNGFIDILINNHK